MFDHETLAALQNAVRERTEADRRLLDEQRDEVRPLLSSVRTIKPRSTTSVSLVASDGGNNKLVFDPFTVQLVRVVDSYGKELFFDVISPTTDTDKLSAAQFNSDGSPKTALGRMMKDLGDLKTLTALSHMIPDGKKTREQPHKVSPSWVLVYRDLCEWAVLYDRICYHTFASDTLIVRDSLLRSKLFRGEMFVELRKKLEAAITRIREQDRRWVFLVGIAKHSTVLTRYHLALTIEKIMPPGEARYVKVPREIEAKAYVWPEWRVVLRPRVKARPRRTSRATCISSASARRRATRSGRWTSLVARRTRTQRYSATCWRTLSTGSRCPSTRAACRRPMSSRRWWILT